MTKIKIMSQETADNYYKMLYRYFKVIDELGLKSWLFAGTLIGSIRESAILSWDKDVDVAMLEDDRKILWENQDVIEKWGLKTNYTDSIYRMDFNGVYMDLFSYRLEGNKYVEIHQKNRIRWPDSFFLLGELFPLKVGKFGPLNLPIPKESEKILSRMYGDWRTIPKMFLHLEKYKMESSKDFKDHLQIEHFTNNVLSNSNKCYSVGMNIIYWVLLLFLILRLLKK